MVDEITTTSKFDMVLVDEPASAAPDGSGNAAPGRDGEAPRGTSSGEAGGPAPPRGAPAPVGERRALPQKSPPRSEPKKVGSALIDDLLPGGDDNGEDFLAAFEREFDDKINKS